MGVVSGLSRRSSVASAVVSCFASAAASRSAPAAAADACAATKGISAIQRNSIRPEVIGRYLSAGRASGSCQRPSRDSGPGDRRRGLLVPVGVHRCGLSYTGPEVAPDSLLVRSLGLAYRDGSCARRRLGESNHRQSGMPSREDRGDAPSWRAGRWRWPDRQPPGRSAPMSRRRRAVPPSRRGRRPCRTEGVDRRPPRNGPASRPVVDRGSPAGMVCTIDTGSVKIWKWRGRRQRGRARAR